MNQAPGGQVKGYKTKSGVPQGRSDAQRQVTNSKNSASGTQDQNVGSQSVTNQSPDVIRHAKGMFPSQSMLTGQLDVDVQIEHFPESKGSHMQNQGEGYSDAEDPRHY